MRLPAGSTDQTELGRLGAEAARLLRSRDYRALADSFGYALSFDRDPASAIQQDLTASLSELGATQLVQTADDPAPRVSYFRPNESNLFALVEVLLSAGSGKAVLLELIITAMGTEKHAYLEQLSPVA